jgi:hypothetical protein
MDEDVRRALGALATDEPPLGFGTEHLIEGGRRTRRRRAMFVTGGVSVAVAGVLTLAAVAIPVVAGDHNGTTRAGAPTTAKPSVTLRPSPPTATCPTDQQWNTHVAYTAAVRAVLPPISGTLVDMFVRDRSMCGLDSYRTAAWNVFIGGRAGQVGLSSNRNPGQYRQWTVTDPCRYQRHCTVEHHGKVTLIVLVRDEGSNATDSNVIAVFPDDTVVDVAAVASAPITNKPALDHPPLTRDQVVALALSPAARG